MKRAFVFLAVGLLLAGGASVLAADTCGCTFQVNTPNHTQTLGGASGTNSHDGLHQAADNSTAVRHVMPAG